MDDPIAGRVGGNLTLPIPNTARASAAMGGAPFARFVQLGLRVFVDAPAAEDTQVTQYADGTFTTPIGPALTIQAGQAGLLPVHAVQTDITNGNIYVRITKPAAGQTTRGRLVIDYFPYLGA
jgi:hypothetical protein